MTDARAPRVLPYGDDAVLVELADLAEVRALDDAVRAARATDPEAGGDRRPGAGGADAPAPGARRRRRPGACRSSAGGPGVPRPRRETGTTEVVLDVVYDGADLDGVARLTG